MFVGTVEEALIEDPIGTDDADDRQIATVHVQRSWKGVGISPEAVASPIKECGVSLIPGYAYLIFAKRDATGRLLTNRCDGTKRVQDSTEDLDRLGPAKAWPMTPISQSNAIRLAIRFWHVRYGHEVEQLSIDNPPHVDDLGYAWRVWVKTAMHQLLPLDVDINKETYELSDLRHPQGSDAR